MLCSGCKQPSGYIQASVLIAPLFLASALNAQPVEIETKIDRLEAKIGEVFTLTFSAVYDSSIQLTAPDIGQRLDSFEVQSALFSEEIALENGQKARGGEIKLWALDTGQFIIPALAIPYVTSDGSQKTVSTSAYEVSVGTNLDQEDDSAGLAALREPLQNPLFLTRRLTDRWQFWAGLGAILLIGALVAWRYLRRKDEALQWADTRPAWEKAFERLAGLRNSPHLANAEHKAFYSELANILKEFMGRITSLPALDMTTSELLAAADGQLALKSHRAEMERVLRQADLVKFAKVSPTREVPERDFEVTYSLVQTVRDRELERQREEQRRLTQQARSESTAPPNDLDKPSAPAKVKAQSSRTASDTKNTVKHV